MLSIHVIGKIVSIKNNEREFRQCLKLKLKKLIETTYKILLHYIQLCAKCVAVSVH